MACARGGMTATCYFSLAGMPGPYLGGNAGTQLWTLVTNAGQQPGKGDGSDGRSTTLPSVSMASEADDDSLRGITVKSFAGSVVFERTFDEGMGLVEETARYLDGRGQQAATPARCRWPGRTR